MDSQEERDMMKAMEESLKFKEAEDLFQRDFQEALRRSKEAYEDLREDTRVEATGDSDIQKATEESLESKEAEDLFQRDIQEALRLSRGAEDPRKDVSERRPSKMDGTRMRSAATKSTDRAHQTRVSATDDTLSRAVPRPVILNNRIKRVFPSPDFTLDTVENETDVFLRITRERDNTSFIFYLLKYPWKVPTMVINTVFSSDRLQLSPKLLDEDVKNSLLPFIDYYDTLHTSFNVLIYCHRTNPDKHWQRDIIAKLVDKHNTAKLRVTYTTLDTKGTLDTSERSDMHLMMDGFNVSGNKFEHMFDLIILPDCGGKYWELQADKSNYDEFSRLITEEVNTFANQHGHIYFGKIVSKDFFDALVRDTRFTYINDLYLGTDLMEYFMYAPHNANVSANVQFETPTFNLSKRFFPPSKDALEYNRKMNSKSYQSKGAAKIRNTLEDRTPKESKDWQIEEDIERDKRVKRAPKSSGRDIKPQRGPMQAAAGIETARVPGYLKKKQTVVDQFQSIQVTPAQESSCGAGDNRPPDGMKIEVVVGDGNCFFRAIAVNLSSIFGKHKGYRQVKRDLLEYLNDHERELGELGFFTSQDIRETRNILQTNSSYGGGDLFFGLVTLVYKVKLDVYQVESGKNVILDTRKKLTYDPQNFGGASTNDVATILFKRCLEGESGNHYDAIIPV